MRRKMLNYCRIAMRRNYCRRWARSLVMIFETDDDDLDDQL
jgi:hypothetical protein